MSKQLLVLVYPGVAEWEITYPLFILHPNVDYRFVSIGPPRVRGVMGMEITAHEAIDTADPGSAAGIFLPGGIDPQTQRFPRSLGDDARLLSLLRRFHTAGKAIAAICGAPLILGAAGLLRGRRFASDITQDTRGWFDEAERAETPVAADGNLLTSELRAMAPFTVALARLLGEEPVAEETLRMILGPRDLE